MGAGLLLAGGAAAAHVRWFVEEESAAGGSYVLDRTAVAIIGGAVLFVVAMVAVHRSAAARRLSGRIVRALDLPAGTEWRIVAFLAGILLVASTSMRVFLAPNLDPPGAVATPALVVQMVAGLLLLAQVSFAVPGLLVLLLSALAVVTTPLRLTVDYVPELLTLSLAFLLIGPGHCPLDARLLRSCRPLLDGRAHLALPLIRVGLGATLVILAVHNKLSDPGLALAFLAEHDMNFMPALGFAGFTDLHFALAAGVAELTLGLLLVAGVATRLVTAVLSTFFVMTLFVLGPVELVGHAPLFGVCLLLIVRGSGSLRSGARAA